MIVCQSIVAFSNGPSWSTSHEANNQIMKSFYTNLKWDSFIWLGFYAKSRRDRTSFEKMMFIIDLTTWNYESQARSAQELENLVRVVKNAFCFAGMGTIHPRDGINNLFHTRRWSHYATVCGLDDLIASLSWLADHNGVVYGYLSPELWKKKKPLKLTKSINRRKIIKKIPCSSPRARANGQPTAGEEIEPPVAPDVIADDDLLPQPHGQGVVPPPRLPVEKGGAETRIHLQVLALSSINRKDRAV